MKYVAPNIESVAFNCPHCEAYTTQFWYQTSGFKLARNYSPGLITSEHVKEYDLTTADDGDAKAYKYARLTAMAEGKLVFGITNHAQGVQIDNLSISECYVCGEMSLWIYDKLIYPNNRNAPPPNEDLPDAIKRDYNEARSIMHLSPRGAAALLRLCIQKLCIALGQPGNDLNRDIGALVEKGLDKKIQEALDIVRVIGNEAVHPGTIDLDDNIEIVGALFLHINIIAERMISQPKQISELYSSLPEPKLRGIKQRDRKKS